MINYFKPPILKGGFKIFLKTDLHFIKACVRILLVDGQRENLRGDIAQLGERLNGIQEVRGSSPLISTNKKITLL